MRKRAYLLLALFFSASLPAAEWSFVGQDIEPFFFQDEKLPTSGIFKDVASEICRQMRHDCSFSITPFRRSLEAVKSGAATFVGPLALTPDRKDMFLFSDVVVRSSYTFYGQEKEVVNLKSIEDLRGKTIGVHSPSATEKSLLRINEKLGNSINIVNETGVETAIKKSQHNRYNLSYINQDIARAWIKNNKVGDLFEASFTGDFVDYRFAFTPQTDAKTLAEFNRILQDLKAKGMVDAIVGKYIKKKLPG